MNFDQFNEKSKLLINEAQNKAISLNHQQILPLHLLYSILDDKNDLILDLFNVFYNCLVFLLRSLLNFKNSENIIRKSER